MRFLRGSLGSSAQKWQGEKGGGASAVHPTLADQKLEGRCYVGKQDH